MKNKLKKISDRIKGGDQVEQEQRSDFLSLLKKIPLSKGSKLLSVSTGDGSWDYLCAKYRNEISKITAIDIIKCPIGKESVALLNKYCDWIFRKVKAEKQLPFNSGSFDLVIHNDVLEHVEKPFLFLSEQYRVLKSGGYLLFGTPNLLRPANIIKLLFGRLGFPKVLCEVENVGKYIHIQEYTPWQLEIYLKEVGFKIIEMRYQYFGLYPIKIRFKKSPRSPLKYMAHLVMVLAVKI